MVFKDTCDDVKCVKKFIIIIHNYLFFTNSVVMPNFFRRLNVNLVILLNDSFLYKLIDFIFGLFYL